MPFHVCKHGTGKYKTCAFCGKWRGDLYCGIGKGSLEKCKIENIIKCPLLNKKKKGANK